MFCQPLHDTGFSYFLFPLWSELFYTQGKTILCSQTHILLYFVLLNSQLRVVAELPHADLFHSANIVSRYI